MDLFFNIETLRANENRLALELSRNPKEIRKVENDKEKTQMIYLQFVAERTNIENESGKKLTSAQRNQISHSLVGKNGTLKKCLQSELVMTYWDALTTIKEGRAFLNTKYFSSKWSNTVIHRQPGGGVSAVSWVNQIETSIYV